ncbi:MAG: hypothetical protein FWD33_01105 [Alphaproteobacteria bacterium]|nr:hypothetical protein [Alphaproteobacteria bacterium]
MPTRITTIDGINYLEYVHPTDINPNGVYFIPKDVNVIRGYAFCDFKEDSDFVIDFEEKSNLREVEYDAFRRTGVTSISLPYSAPLTITLVSYCKKLKYIRQADCDKFNETFFEVKKLCGKLFITEDEKIICENIKLHKAFHIETSNGRLEKGREVAIAQDTNSGKTYQNPHPEIAKAGLIHTMNPNDPQVEEKFKGMDFLTAMDFQTAYSLCHKAVYISSLSEEEKEIVDDFFEEMLDNNISVGNMSFKELICLSNLTLSKIYANLICLAELKYGKESKMLNTDCRICHNNDKHRSNKCPAVIAATKWKII